MKVWILKNRVSLLAAIGVPAALVLQLTVTESPYRFLSFCFNCLLFTIFLNLINYYNEAIQQQLGYVRQIYNSYSRLNKKYLQLVRHDFKEKFNPCFNSFFADTPINKYVYTINEKGHTLKIGNDDFMVPIDADLYSQNWVAAFDKAKNEWERSQNYG